MSTRANIIIKDANSTLYLYRHSDGYPECTGADLMDFVKDYATGAMRNNAPQSAGWLIIRGHYEYNPKGLKQANLDDRFAGWKVGAYEPTDQLHGDVEYVYIIDLDKDELSCVVPKGSKYWDSPCLDETKPFKDFKPVKIGARP